MASETLTLIINADSKDAQAKLKAVSGALKDQEKESSSLSGSLSKLKQNWLAVTATLATVSIGFKKVITDASNLQEVSSKFEVVFKGQMETAEQFADTLVESYAMSTREAKQYLSSVQDLLVPMGMAADKAAEMSNEVVKLAADLGSFNNVSTEQAMMDLQSALVGNYETMKKYGVVLNDTVVKQEAMRQGLWDGKGMLDANTKAQIAFELAMRGSEAAQGDMIRTGDSWANIAKKIQARVEDISAGIGSQMLPALSRLGNAFILSTQSGGVFNTVISAITKTVSLAMNSIAQLVTWIERINNLGNKSKEEREINNLLLRRRQIFQDYGVLTGNTLKADRESARLLKEKVDKGLVNKYVQQDIERITKQIGDAASRNIEYTDKETSLASRMQEIDDAILGGQREINDAKKEGLDIQAQMNDASGGGSGYDPVAAKEAQRQRELEIDMAYYEELGAFSDEWHAIQDEKEQARYEAQVEKASQVLGAVQTVTQGIGDLFAQSYQNDQIKLDNWYNKKKKTIERTIKDEDKKEAALAKLDEEYNDKKKKNARDYAKTKKAISIVEAIIATALGVTNSLSQGGVMGIVMAAIIGALGIAQIALIASQEIPAAASGALIKGSAAGTLIQAGEGGRSEMIVPFENEEVMSKVGGFGGGTTVNVNAQYLFANEDLPMDVAVKIDRALYKLRQNKGSVNW